MEFSSELPLFTKKAEKWISSFQSFISANFNISRRKQMVELSNELMALLKNSGVIISTTFSTAIHTITALILVPVFTFFFLFYRDFFETFLQIFMLSVVANFLYCFAYIIDLPAQYSSYRQQWLQWRWILWVIGMLFAASIATQIMQGMLYPDI